MLELATGIGTWKNLKKNTVNSGIFNGWGDKGIGSIVEHDVFDRFYGDKSWGGRNTTNEGPSL